MAIRVLIIDDSATARAVLSEILSNQKDIEVVGTAPDAYTGRDKVVELRPDVITLDIEMPRMDGISFLKKLMRHVPTPVIMVSSLTRKGAQLTLEALDAGAVDFVEKPHSYMYDQGGTIAEELIEKVHAASKAHVFTKTSEKAPLHNAHAYTSLAETTKKIIAIGASTGGTQALKDLLIALPRNTPGILIVQHMPGTFTAAFAARLNELCEMDVKEANNGDHVNMGQVLIAPGDYHMVLRRSGATYTVEIGSGGKVSGHRPSADVLFNSVAKNAGSNAVGVLLTGMGADGAKGLLNMHNSGAKTIAQDEQSCVVFGMPKVAIELGAADYVLPLRAIAGKVLHLL